MLYYIKDCITYIHGRSFLFLLGEANFRGRKAKGGEYPFLFKKRPTSSSSQVRQMPAYPTIFYAHAYISCELAYNLFLLPQN